jgi:hypothetical protein
MSNDHWTGIILAVAAIGFIIALGLMIHSCGSTIEVTCPGGGSATITQTGSFGGEESAKGVCQKLEEKESE